MDINSGEFAGLLNDIAMEAHCNRFEAMAAIDLIASDEAGKAHGLGLLKGSDMEAGVLRALEVMRHMVDDRIREIKEADGEWPS